MDKSYLETECISQLLKSTGYDGCVEHEEIYNEWMYNTLHIV